MKQKVEKVEDIIEALYKGLLSEDLEFIRMSFKTDIPEFIPTLGKLIQTRFDYSKIYQRESRIIQSALVGLWEKLQIKEESNVI